MATKTTPIELTTMTYEVTGRIARITLDRPHRGNGITLELPRELGARGRGRDGAAKGLHGAIGNDEARSALRRLRGVFYVSSATTSPVPTRARRQSPTHFSTIRVDYKFYGRGETPLSHPPPTSIDRTAFTASPTSPSARSAAAAAAAAAFAFTF